MQPRNISITRIGRNHWVVRERIPGASSLILHGFVRRKSPHSKYYEAFDEQHRPLSDTDHNSNLHWHRETRQDAVDLVLGITDWTEAP